MEPNRRRSNLEIISDILRLGEASKTKIMYSSNMSHAQLERYLDFLVERGFLRRQGKPNPGTLYHVTDKGKSLLEGIDTVHKLLEH